MFSFECRITLNREKNECEQVHFVWLQYGSAIEYIWKVAVLYKCPLLLTLLWLEFKPLLWFVLTAWRLTTGCRSLPWRSYRIQWQLPPSCWMVSAGTAHYPQYVPISSATHTCLSPWQRPPRQFNKEREGVQLSFKSVKNTHLQLTILCAKKKLWYYKITLANNQFHFHTQINIKNAFTGHFIYLAQCISWSTVCLYCVVRKFWPSKFAK